MNDHMFWGSINSNLFKKKKKTKPLLFYLHSVFLKKKISNRMRALICLFTTNLTTKRKKRGMRKCNIIYIYLCISLYTYTYI